MIVYVLTELINVSWIGGCCYVILEGFFWFSLCILKHEAEDPFPTTTHAKAVLRDFGDGGQLIAVVCLTYGNDFLGDITGVLENI
jgi:hypothetical protein